MAKDKNAPRYDKQGARRVMRKRDYLSDFSGQLALGLMANIVGQLNYFYTDKVGLAVGSVGIILAISKVIDAFTDVIAGNLIDHSKGGDHKYFKWILPQIIPAAAIVVLMFTVPIQAGQIPGVIYALVTNLILSAGLYTFIATPFAAVMTVRTRSLSERGSIGLFRAIANYGAGMLISILTIPVTNMLGGTQSAWIKYGVVLAVLVFVLFAVCCRNGMKSKFACDYEEEETDGQPEEEEEPVPFKEAMTMLLKNKYWVIILLFNLITSITSGIAASGGTYYCKWIFGNDNLVGIIGAVGMLATVVGFVLSKPIIAGLGIKRTISIGLLGAAVLAGIRCFVPTNFAVYVVTSLLGSFVQIPMMSLYGVLTSMTIDYNEWKYDKKLVAMSGGAIGFGSKVGNGLGAAVLSAFLAIGAYDATLEVASTSMTYSIYGFSNYLPVVINLIMFVIFLKFDLEEKLPKMREEIAARRAAKSEAK
ncbi:MFS transporter [Mediterraneibacter glycyrrhizinilyticus]|uniref:MFS transporter n=1 Tax=Mediterraneibacter glycyrrhizinilyticus TaxID=342942 RepID=UPI001960115F|nr:MFS transporter [Mediterraneibacter glycyrrhizinilyticus]MBM6802800.1 MFS transporter [Mediterraneibacter glycyrrhizinilyticus]MDM8209822.1 MFS transporter [Mediterraneibacter glycyrrhizinilyticus]